ncbi:MAG TPA: trypsin-like peptidase domain-containing protein [Candidatus Aphodovivens avistercoris]|nr:trypsin-like peptidase domain-containing protein [Candidatus Aphodovivens avistercoris]
MTNEYGYNANGKPPASGAPQSPAGYQSAQGASSGTGFGQPQGTGSSGYQAYQQATAATASTGFAAASAGAGGSGSPTGGPSGAHGSGKKPGGARTFLLGFAGAALACVLALGGFALWQGAAGPSGSTVIGGAGSSVNASDEDATLAEAVAEKALPSVAAIDVYTEDSGMYGMYGYGAGSGELTETSLGSGVVISEDGYIITNNHVVEGADALRVTIDGQEYDAEIVGTDPSSDLAVVKAEGASGLTAIELGDSDNLTIGEWVMSIGSPFGLEQSVATGIVSATNRSQIMDSSSDAYGQGETTVYTNMIQTDAAINPGNSGGALVDADGKLIGINTLITSYSGNYSGVGFAIPVNYAVSIAQQIIDGETPSHAQLGVTMSTVNAQIADRYGFAVDEGAYVSAVQQGSGAAEAGIQAGDIVTKFDGETVTSASDLTLAVRSKNVGDTVSVEVNRNGQTLAMDVTLGSDSASSSASTQQQSASGGSLFDQLFGGGQQQRDAA